ncbi:MAG TPA: enoyl-CoA hydratase [Stellaceae bacterium]|nr:enoyl-CoA hydratase [Stellaceae bacterium]
MTVEVAREERTEGGFVARVTIDRAAKLNALDRALIAEIIEAMTALAAEPELRLAVVTGAGGRAFIGGADIDELAGLDADSARHFITAVHVCCDAFRHLPVPVVAQIDGYALGAGLELAAACDFRIASERSVFGMPEVRIGIPSVVEAALLPKLIGPSRARQLLLTGENIDAATALDWGLVDRVLPAAKLDAAVEALATPILAAGSHAIRIQKALILDWEEMHTHAAVERGIEAFVDAFATDEPRRMTNAARAAMQARRKNS